MTALEAIGALVLGLLGAAFLWVSALIAWRMLESLVDRVLRFRARRHLRIGGWYEHPHLGPVHLAQYFRDDKARVYVPLRCAEKERHLLLSGCAVTNQWDPDGADHCAIVVHLTDLLDCPALDSLTIAQAMTFDGHGWRAIDEWQTQRRETP